MERYLFASDLRFNPRPPRQERRGGGGTDPKFRFRQRSSTYMLYLRPPIGHLPYSFTSTPKNFIAPKQFTVVTRNTRTQRLLLPVPTTIRTLYRGVCVCTHIKRILPTSSSCTEFWTCYTVVRQTYSSHRPYH